MTAPCVRPAYAKPTISDEYNIPDQPNLTVTWGTDEMLHNFILLLLVEQTCFAIKKAPDVHFSSSSLKSY